MFGSCIPATTLERLWIMLAHNQGILFNASRLANSLAVSAPTVTSYIGLLIDLLLVRRLPPFHANVKKRLVISAIPQDLDSGLVHALLGIETHDELLGHPVVGASWEGFVIENLLAVAPGPGPCQLLPHGPRGGDRPVTGARRPARYLGHRDQARTRPQGRKRPPHRPRRHWTGPGLPGLLRNGLVSQRKRHRGHRPAGTRRGATQLGIM